MSSSKERNNAANRNDEELDNLVARTFQFFGPESTEGRYLAETMREAYSLGFKRGFRAAKMEDMPWWFQTEQEEKEWLHRNNIDDSSSISSSK